MNPLMRKSLGLGAVLALLAGPAMAQQGPPPGHDQNHGMTMQHQPRPPAPMPPHQPGPPRHEAYGPPHGGWHRGDHYDGHRMVVHDWHHYRLHAPPPGYEWVQVNGQFMMIAITTGLIASIIAGAEAH